MVASYANADLSKHYATPGVIGGPRNRLLLSHVGQREVDLISLGPGATSRITQAESLTIKTEQHAGHRGMPMPRRLDLGGHQVDVFETLDQWYGPDYRYIKARGTDGGLYILRFDEPQAEWELTMFKSARA